MELSHLAENSKGLLIMFDGPDGVGKSTQLTLAKNALERAGIVTHTSRLNGGTPIGEALRAISLNPTLKRCAIIDLHILLAMYYALANDLKERIDSGTICLVDRSPLSLIAYQVFGSGLNMEEGEKAAHDAVNLFKPDLIICYDAPEPILLKHRKKRDHSKKADYFENQPVEYMERVIRGYHEAYQMFEVKVVNAGRDKSSIHHDTMGLINAAIENASHACSA